MHWEVDLFKKYYSGILRTIDRKVQNLQDAEDLTVDVFITAFLRIDRINQQKSIANSLYQIAVRHTLSFIHRNDIKNTNTHNSYYHEEIKFLDLLNINGNLKEAETIETIFNNYLPNYKKLIFLRYKEKLSYKEIAIQLKTDIGNIKGALSKARKILYKINFKQQNDSIVSNTFSDLLLADVLNSSNVLVSQRKAKSIAAVISLLPLNYQSIINCRIKENLSYKEIALKLNVDYIRVKETLIKARKLLNSILKHQKPPNKYLLNQLQSKVDYSVSWQEKLYEKYNKGILETINQIVGNKQVAEDLTIEAFELAFKSINTYNHFNPISTWLYKLAVKHSITCLREGNLRKNNLNKKTNRDSKKVNEASTQEAEFIVFGLKELKSVQKIINCLSKDYKNILTYRFEKFLSFKEISEKLGSETKYVKARFNRIKNLILAITKSKNSKDNNFYTFFFTQIKR